MTFTTKARRHEGHNGVFALVLLLALPAFAEVSIVIPRSAGDGPAWQDAAVLDRFSIASSSTPSTKLTSARVCCNRRNLYIRLTFAEPRMDRLKADSRLRNNDVWKDDSAQIWLRFGTNRLAFDQFIVNSLGTMGEHRLRGGVVSALDKPQWQAKVVRGKESWTIDLCIPASDLGADEFRRGDLIGVKIGRADYQGDGQDPRLICWPPGAPFAGFDGFARVYIEDANLVGEKWGGDLATFQRDADAGVSRLPHRSAGQVRRHFPVAEAAAKRQPIG